MNSRARTIDMKMVQAWLMAANELGIKVTAPFTMPSPSGDTETFEALVHEFGGPKGTVIGRVAAHDSTVSRMASGYYSSNLSDSYQRYDRSLFLATLDDWKWFGRDAERPAWYSGRDWS